jgi:hypothetical protein
MDVNGSVKHSTSVGKEMDRIKGTSKNRTFSAWAVLVDFRTSI